MISNSNPSLLKRAIRMNLNASCFPTSLSYRYDQPACWSSFSGTILPRFDLALLSASWYACRSSYRKISSSSGFPIG